MQVIRILKNLRWPPDMASHWRGRRLRSDHWTSHPVMQSEPNPSLPEAPCIRGLQHRSTTESGAFLCSSAIYFRYRHSMLSKDEHAFYIHSNMTLIIERNKNAKIIFLPLKGFFYSSYTQFGYWCYLSQFYLLHLYRYKWLSNRRAFYSILLR